MDYQSPGAAFSGAIEEHLATQAAMKRQAMLDALAAKKEEDLTRYRDEEMKQRREEAQARRDDLLDRANERDRADFEKRVTGMLPGDQPDPEMIKKDQKYGTGFFKLPTPKPRMPDLPPNTAGVGGGLERTGPTGPAGPGSPPADVGGQPLPEPGPATYPGNRQDRQKADLDAKVKVIRDKIATLDPTDPEFKKAVMDYEMLTNKSIPAGMVKSGTTTDTEAVVRQNPTKGIVERLVDGKWVSVTGDVPKGTHFMTPKDTSAADSAAAARRDNSVERVRTTALSELNTRSKPLEDQILRLNKLDTSLNQNSDIADSTLAEQIVTLTAGGAGSGVRISQPMIAQVLNKSRTHWGDLEVALRRWEMATPDEKNKPSLFFNDTQKQAMRDLARAYRQEANKVHKKLIDARHQIDEAEDVPSIRRAATRAQEDLYSDDETPTPGGAGKPADLVFDPKTGTFKKPGS